MFPIYFLVGIINIFAQHNNYGIKNQDPDIDIRVRRSIPNTSIKGLFNLQNIENDTTKRDKRYASYTKIKISKNNNINNNLQRDFVSENYRNQEYNNSRNTITNNGYNNRPYIRSYPYGYPPGYEPTAATPGYNKMSITAGYNNENNANTPYYYNYQNPNGYNFAGFYGYNTPGYNVPASDTPSYTLRPNNYALWSTNLAPYPPSTTQKPVSNPTFDNSALPSSNNEPTPYGQHNSTGIHNSPYNTQPSQNSGINYNLASHTPKYTSNNTNNFNNTIIPYIPNNNNTNITNISVNNQTSSTTPKIVRSCIICFKECPQFMRRLGGFCIPDDYD